MTALESTYILHVSHSLTGYPTIISSPRTLFQARSLEFDHQISPQPVTVNQLNRSEIYNLSRPFFNQIVEAIQSKATISLNSLPSDNRIPQNVTQTKGSTTTSSTQSVIFPMVFPNFENKDHAIGDTALIPNHVDTNKQSVKINVAKTYLSLPSESGPSADFPRLFDVQYLPRRSSSGGLAKTSDGMPFDIHNGAPNLSFAMTNLTSITGSSDIRSIPSISSPDRKSVV